MLSLEFCFREIEADNIPYIESPISVQFAIIHLIWFLLLLISGALLTDDVVTNCGGCEVYEVAAVGRSLARRLVVVLLTCRVISLLLLSLSLFLLLVFMLLSLSLFFVVVVVVVVVQTIYLSSLQAFGLISALIFLIDAIYHWKMSTSSATGTSGGGSGGRTVVTKTTVVKTTRTAK